jgi:hypothetical protein
MNFGPVVMTTVGDTFTPAARILAVVWDAATSSGHTVELRCPSTGRLLWAARTSDTHTYLGINLGVEGQSAPFGFTLAQISAGRLLVYLREN